MVTIASSSDSRRDVGPAAYGWLDTIESIVVIAREHRGSGRSGAGTIEEGDMVIGIATGVVAANVE